MDQIDTDRTESAFTSGLDDLARLRHALYAVDRELDFVVKILDAE